MDLELHEHQWPTAPSSDRDRLGYLFA